MENHAEDIRLSTLQKVAAALGKAVLFAGGTVGDPAPLERWAGVIHPAGILRANVAQRGLMVQRSVVTIRSAIEKLYETDD